MQLLLFLSVPLSASAETTSCNSKINEKSVSLQYDSADEELFSNYTWREIFLRGWGEITCPAFVTLRHLTPGITDAERSIFCLNYEKDSKIFTGYSVGQRDAYLVCVKPSKKFCERVNESKDTAIAITGAAFGATGSAALATAGTGITAVAHSSGAVILTGAGGYIAGTLASIGAGALAILTAPAAIAATTISVVAVGGSVYLCKE